MSSMRLNYENIKRHYDLYGDEIKYLLYIHYYPIVEKIYDRNNGKLDKILLENYLKEIINSYVIDGNKSTNPSKYIHEKMYKYEKSYYLNKLKKCQHELINTAYRGDTKARYELFLSCTGKIDDTAQILYNNIISNMTNINYSLDDIKKVLYQDIWNLINRFYDRENKGLYLSTAVSGRLRDLSIRINKYIDNNNINALEILKNNSITNDLDKEFGISRRK